MKYSSFLPVALLFAGAAKAWDASKCSSNAYHCVYVDGAESKVQVFGSIDRDGFEKYLFPATSTGTVQLGGSLIYLRFDDDHVQLRHNGRLDSSNIKLSAFLSKFPNVYVDAYHTYDQVFNYRGGDVKVQAY